MVLLRAETGVIIKSMFHDWFPLTLVSDDSIPAVDGPNEDRFALHRWTLQLVCKPCENR